MIRRKLGTVLLVGLFALFALFTTGAEARRPHHAAAEQAASSGQSGVFDYYVLTLSWSPTYCLTHQGDSQQCGAHKGLGFVLHGLWPQYTSGGWPENCATKEKLTPEAVKFGQTIFPSDKLIEHEWSRHGTCNGTSALDYFKTADGVRTGVKVPASLDAPAKTLSMTASEIAASFAAANPGAKAVVGCTGPELNQVQFCFDRKLAPMPCGKGVKSNCRPGPIRIPALR